MLNPYDIYITPEEYELAASHGVSAAMLDRRVRQQDWTKEKAMTTPPRRLKPRGHYAEWLKRAKQNGIKNTTFYNRINMGWSVEDASTKPMETVDELIERALKARESKRIIPDHYIRTAVQNGISYRALYMRVRVCKWDYKRAATEPIWTPEQKGKLGAQRLRERKGDRSKRRFE